MRLTFPTVTLLVSALALAPLGCSFSKSSESISKSVSSPFASSSKSSRSRGQKYEEDVRDYTAGYVKGGGATADGLRTGLANVAREHGVTNWEADENTFEGVGKGLAKAGLSQAEYQGYRDSVAAGNAGNAAAIDRGYKSGGK